MSNGERFSVNELRLVVALPDAQVRVLDVHCNVVMGTSHFTHSTILRRPLRIRSTTPTGPLVELISRVSVAAPRRRRALMPLAPLALAARPRAAIARSVSCRAWRVARRPWRLLTAPRVPPGARAVRASAVLRPSSAARSAASAATTGIIAAWLARVVGLPLYCTRSTTPSSRRIVRGAWCGRRR